MHSSNNLERYYNVSVIHYSPRQTIVGFSLYMFKWHASRCELVLCMSSLGQSVMLGVLKCQMSKSTFC